RWARVTTALARAVALLARKLSWAEVATHFGLDWKTVAAIVREAVATGLKLRRWRPLHVIGIDKLSRAKGQTYLTLVYDPGGHVRCRDPNRDGASGWHALRGRQERRACAVHAGAPGRAGTDEHRPVSQVLRCHPAHWRRDNVPDVPATTVRAHTHGRCPRPRLRLQPPAQGESPRRAPARGPAPPSSPAPARAPACHPP